MSEFHEQLDDLDDRFTAAGIRLHEEMPRLIAAYLANDHGAIERASALATDVGQECRAVEDGGLILLARHQPVAGDLRRLVALARMCFDVDRSSALLRHLCETLQDMDPSALPSDVYVQVGALAERAADVFGRGIDAWRRRDALAVNELDRMDEDVDNLQHQLVQAAGDRDDLADVRLSLGLLARYAERIADHGVAIARDTAFVATGERVQLPSKLVR